VTAVASPDDTGFAIAAFPASVGTDPDDLPALTCSRRNPATGQWWVVAEGFSETSPWCVLAFVGGRWEGWMFGIPTGWVAAFVVIY
jgi:hypothetical protein